MSVATKGVIKFKEQYTYGDKEIAHIINTIKKAMLDLSCCIKFGTDVIEENFDYVLKETVCHIIFINFYYTENENKRISIYLNYDNKGNFKNIQLSIEKWEKSSHLMRYILEYFYSENNFDVYFLEDDTNNDWEKFLEDEWVKLNENEIDEIWVKK